MKIGFNELGDYVIPLSDFTLNWRFAGDNHSDINESNLSQLKPLNNFASKFLFDFLLDKQLRKETPFKKDLFATISQIDISNKPKEEISSWLFDLDMPLNKSVFLSWSPSMAMIVPWGILIHYFDDFYYPISDDLTVFDQELNWALLFFHNEQIYFGNNL